MSANRRSAKVVRKTSETDITLELCLDGSGSCQSSTGVGFFDHMLDAFSRHGLFDFQIKHTQFHRLEVKN